MKGLASDKFRFYSLWLKRTIIKAFRSDKFRFYSLCVLLLAGLIITYSNHFRNPFHFDDEHTIVNNVWIKSIKNIPKFFIDGKTSSSLPQNQVYRPGLTTINAIDYWISSKNPFHISPDPLYGYDKGLTPFYYHLTIFICLILQAILMFLLFKKILDLSVAHRWNKYFALFAVALYCFHTAMAETVNYIISRSDGFSTLFFVLAFVIFVYYPLKRKYFFYLIPYIIGFFVKEPALMFGPILFFYIAIFEKQTDLGRMFSKENRHKLWVSFKEVIPVLLAGAALYIIHSILTPKTFTPSIISSWDYLKTQPFVVVQYFKTFILPTELSADTDWKALTTIYDMRFLMGLMFVTGMVWFALRLSGKKVFSPVSFGILWFFIALIPTSSIIPLSEVLNDHRIFFPYIGLALAFSTMLIYLIILRDEFFFTSSKYQQAMTGILVILILGSFAYGTHQRNKVWSSEEMLWQDVAVKSPENGRGLMNYALTQMAKGNYPDAKTYFFKALKLAPAYSLAHINLAVLYSALNDTKTAEQYFKSAIAIGTYIDQSYYYYGNFLFKQKRYDEAKLMFQNSISNNPAYTPTRYALMALYSETEDWDNLQRLAEETLQYLPNDASCLTYIDASKNKKTKLDIAVETAKKNPTAANYLNLSLYYYEAGLYNDCVSACIEATKIKPDFALAYNNMCSAYNQLKMYDKAIEACNKALAIQPDFDLAKNNLKAAISAKNN